MPVPSQHDPSEPTPARGAAAQVRVVIIDGADDMRELLAFALGQHGFVVVGESADGRAGIALAEHTSPDLVLLDLSVPVTNGLTVLPLLRRACPNATIIVLSGPDAAAMAATARQLGADGYLRQGTGIVATVAYVREVLGHRAPPDTHPAPAGAGGPEGGAGAVAPTSVAPAPAAPSAAGEVLHGAVTMLREPIRTLRTLSERLATEGPATNATESRRQAVLCEQLLRETQRVEALSDDLDTASLHERGLLRSKPSWYRVGELVERVGSTMAIELACHPDTMVHVDEGQVRHLLTSLARDAAQQGRSPAVLRADVGARELRLDVVDLTSGSAAPPRPADAPSAASPSGLDRYLVRALAAAHGGTVEDEPGATGGSSLTVRIPQPRA